MAFRSYKRDGVYAVNEMWERQPRQKKISSKFPPKLPQCSPPCEKRRWAVISDGIASVKRVRFNSRSVPWGSRFFRFGSSLELVGTGGSNRFSTNMTVKTRESIDDILLNFRNIWSILLSSRFYGQRTEYRIYGISVQFFFTSCCSPFKSIWDP